MPAAADLDGDGVLTAEELAAAGIAVMTEAELKKLSELLNMKLDKIVPPDEPGAWFTSFKAMDSECVPRISTRCATSPSNCLPSL